ncbi:hypothetical protein ACFL40_01640 [candidate division KSB1 bacterium]
MNRAKCDFKNLPVFVIYLLFTFLFSSSVFPEARYIYRIPWHGEGKWVIGDTHIHSIHSDGAYTLDEVAKNAQKYKCDFIAFTNHHVSVPQDELDAVRSIYPDLLIFQGTEWSMPAGEHCCIIIPKDPEETIYINEFLNNFGREKAPHKPDTETDSEAALIWLDKHTVGGLKPIAIINHPSRRNAYSYDEIYKYLKAGDVLIGFSGAPGHQSFDSYYNTIDGWDNVYAQVGNLVDMFLNNGIKVLAARAPSDFHGDRSDYWPGEYSRTHIYVKDKTYSSVIEGFRAGAAFADHDNICNKVEFTMNTGKLTEIIPGEMILVDKGDDVNVSIKIQPNSNVVFDEIQFISNNNRVPEISKIFKSNKDIETIIPFDAVWKYIFPEKSPKNWYKTNFNDSMWERGIGLFGYGYSVINTVISKDITDPFNRGRKSIPREYPVTYFRNHFNIENYDLINDFFVDMRYSDGFVMYINGKEVLRKNMPDGKIDNKTTAVKVQGGGLVTYPVLKKYLKKGMNVVAVGLFQSVRGKRNAKFGLQLRGLLNNKSKPDWNSTNDWIEMNFDYKNLNNDFYVRARGKTSIPYKKWFYTNPIIVKVRN